MILYGFALFLGAYRHQSHLLQFGYSERREVKQFQFTAWPDHGVPDHPAPFLQFLRRVRNMNPPDAGPMVVHCRSVSTVYYLEDRFEPCDFHPRPQECRKVISHNPRLSSFFLLN
jgi:hypothetical protein